MPTQPWIKLNRSLLDDPLMRRLPDTLWRRAMELHLLAGEGDCVKTLPPAEMIAARLHRPLPALLEDLDKLTQALLVFQDCQGDWCVLDCKPGKPGEPHGEDGSSSGGSRWKKERK